MSEIVVFEIVGLRPILMNNPKSMQRGGKGGISPGQIPSPEEEAAGKVYRMDDGQLYVPSLAFRGSMIGKGGGCANRKFGKRTANQVISAAVFTVEEECRLYHPKTKKPIKDYEIDSRRAVVQQNGIIRSRPIIREWACDLPLEIDVVMITVDPVLEALNISGKVAGILDFRVQRKGLFGQYKAALKKAAMKKAG